MQLDSSIRGRDGVHPLGFVIGEILLGQQRTVLARIGGYRASQLAAVERLALCGCNELEGPGLVGETEELAA